MMHVRMPVGRKNLIERIELYKPYDAMERTHRLHFLHALRTVPDFAYRTCNEPGHLTACMWIVSHDWTCVLLQLHKYQKIWMPPGGHVDGDWNVVRVQKKEKDEEVGKLRVKLIEDIFDLDTHGVPVNDKKGEPEHLHYDVRGLFMANRLRKLPVSPEGIESRWFTFAEAEEFFPWGGGRRRCLEKIKAWHGTAGFKGVNFKA